MNDHTAENDAHTRTSTPVGPDFCAECSEVAQDWVRWPCPSADNDAGRDGGPRVCQVLMHEVLLDDFQAWLTSRGLVLQRTPFLDESPDLPVYNVAPHPDRMRVIPPGRGGAS